MTIKLIVLVAVLICGIAAGFIFGVNSVAKRASDGICIRANDGEAYLRISEAGQQKLLDPTTKLLYIRVVDLNPRNNQPL